MGSEGGSPLIVSEDELEVDIGMMARNLQTCVEKDMGRADKRNRELDDEEDWTSVARGKKKFLRCDSGDSNKAVVAEEKVEICVTGKEKLPKQIGLARLLKSENIKGVIRVKYLNAYKIIIDFDNLMNAEELLKCKSLIDKGYKCQKTFEVGLSYGTIKNIDLELSDKEVCESLKSEVEIIEVKRQNRRSFDDGTWKPCEVIRICFKGPTLPSYVFVLETRVKVDPYIFPVTQCSRCWKYGHLVRMCPSIKITCPKCGGNHPNCETINYKCINCSGEHMALAKFCPMFLKEKKIRQIMAENNCTYRKALSIYVPPSPPAFTGNTHQNSPTLCKQNDHSSYAEVLESTVSMNTQDDIHTTPTKAVGRTEAVVHEIPNVIPTETNSKKDNIGRKINVNDCGTRILPDPVPTAGSCDDITEADIHNNENVFEHDKTKLDDLIHHIKEIIYSKRHESFTEKLIAAAKLLGSLLLDYIVKQMPTWPFLSTILKP